MGINMNHGSCPAGIKLLRQVRCPAGLYKAAEREQEREAADGRKIVYVNHGSGVAWGHKAAEREQERERE